MKKKQKPVAVCTREEALTVLEMVVGVMDTARTYLKTTALYVLTDNVAMTKTFALDLAKEVAQVSKLSRLALERVVRVIRSRETKGMKP